MSVAGVVLAGGRSVRFGAEDKLYATIGGSTLLERTVAAVAQVADDVIVVLAPGDPTGDVPSAARAAFDPTPDEGPLAGAHAGLLAAVRSDVAVVVGGDMPHLQPPVLSAMIDTIVADERIEMVALDDGEGARPLPIAVRTSPATAAAHALLQAGRRRLRDLVASLRTTVLDEASWTALDPERLTLWDIDEPRDLNR